MNWEPVYALLLFSSTVVTYVAGIGIGRFRHKRKLILGLSVSLNLSLLLFFKYYEFLANNIESILSHAHLSFQMPHFTFLLPVGISFYIFQGLGYMIDIYRKTTKPEQDFFKYALFVSFFPQLVAGPIERSNNLLPQFDHKHKISKEMIWNGITLMVWGYFLKLVLADRCANYVDAIFNNLPNHNGGSYLIALLLFPFQIYGDFAGYSLIAIGASKIMGFKLLDNFCRPFFSSSISDFWRRWHVSLSTWFKDYLYIPMGGSRKSKFKTYRNLIVTFVVSGLWHGADWTFVVWGLLNGIIVSIERAVGFVKKESKGLCKFIRWLFIFLLICILRVFVRAPGLKDVGIIFKGIFTNFDVPFLDKAELTICFLAIMILFLKEFREEKMGNIVWLNNAWGFKNQLALVGLICSILLFGILNGDHFFYFQF